VPVPSLSDWYQLAGAPVSDGRFCDVFFIDTDRGWVINSNGDVHRTQNGGISWSLIDSGFTGLRSVTFFSETRGFIGTLGEEYPLLETIDGGVTWHEIDLQSAVHIGGICGLWRVSSTTVYGCGAFYGDPCLIKTTDGGDTWEVLDLSPVAGTAVACYFPTQDVGLVVGGSSPNQAERTALVIGTDDGGQTWSQRFAGPRFQEWGWKISFPSESTGYVSLQKNFEGAAHFLKTVDGGLTWLDLEFPDLDEQGIGFVTDEVGWIGGWNNPTYVTTNGGLTWSEDGFGMHVNKFQFLGQSLGFAVGRSVYKYDTAVTVDPPTDTANTSLRSFPNPFLTESLIAFVLPEAATVHLSIVTPDGREVIRLLEEPLTAGRHEVVWDGRNDRGREMPEGVYFCTLKAGSFEITQKTLLVR